MGNSIANWWNLVGSWQSWGIPDALSRWAFFMGKTNGEMGYNKFEKFPNDQYYQYHIDSSIGDDIMANCERFIRYIPINCLGMI